MKVFCIHNILPKINVIKYVGIFFSLQVDNYPEPKKASLKYVFPAKNTKKKTLKIKNISKKCPQLKTVSHKLIVESAGHAGRDNEIVYRSATSRERVSAKNPLNKLLLIRRVLDCCLLLPLRQLFAMLSIQERFRVLYRVLFPILQGWDD